MCKALAAGRPVSEILRASITGVQLGDRAVASLREHVEMARAMAPGASATIAGSLCVSESVLEAALDGRELLVLDAYRILRALLASEGQRTLWRARPAVPRTVSG